MQCAELYREVRAMRPMPIRNQDCALPISDSGAQFYLRTALRHVLRLERAQQCAGNTDKINLLRYSLLKHLRTQDVFDECGLRIRGVFGVYKGFFMRYNLVHKECLRWKYKGA